MRRMVVETLVLALVLSGASIGLGQQQPGAPPKPKRIRVAEEVVVPGTNSNQGQTGSIVLNEKNFDVRTSKLEEMLAEALRSNPDIRVAAAKVAEADAELNRTRLQVTQKIVALHAALATQKAEVVFRQTQYERFKQLAADKSIDARLMDEQQQRLTLAKAKLAELEAQMPALLGRVARAPDKDPRNIVDAHVADMLDKIASSSQLEPNMRRHLWLDLTGTLPPPHLLHQAKANGPMADKIRKALQTPIKVDYKDMTFDAILKDLAKKVPGLSFRNMLKLGGNIKEGTMSLRFDEALPVSAILQALADDYRISFVVREYGILVTRRDNVPPEAITVQEFLRQKPAQPTPMEKRDEQSPNAHMMWNPPDNVEGTIKQIDPSGFFQLSFASVDGLLSGHTLYLYRPADGETKAKYLGTVRMINVIKGKGPNGQESLAQPVGRFVETPKVGDKVTSRKPSK